MGKPRIIPKVLVSTLPTRQGHRLTAVRTRRFAQRIPVGTPESQARILQGAQADEIMLIFVDKQLKTQRDEALVLVEQVSRELDVPLTVGGSIESLSDADHLLRAGADRVCVGSSAMKDATLVSTISQRFGAQAVMASVDLCLPARDNPDQLWLRELGTSHISDVINQVDTLCQAGAGQIQLLDMERDGGAQGLDLELLGRISSSVKSVPVVVSGGCGRAQDFTDAFHHLGVSGVAAGTFFTTRDQGPPQVRAQARNSGLPVRKVWRED